MKIGSLRLSNNLVLAPMMNVTTSPFRRFSRTISKEIGLVCVPMLYTKRILKQPKSIVKYLAKIEDEKPVSVQLIGSDIDALHNSIDILESYDFDVLDLNAGCPSKRALKAKEGGYLMKDFKTLNHLIKTAVKYSTRPVSVKVRTGFNDKFDIKEFASIINKSGIDFITIHGRTVKERYQDSKIDLKFIKKIKEALKIPVIGNGNVFSPIDAKQFFDQTNVDALMIGRGCIGNPEIFSKIYNEKIENYENNLVKMQRYVEIYEEIIDDLIEDGIEAQYPIEIFKYTELYRNSIWLSKGIKNSTEIRRKISKTKNLKDLKLILQNLKDR